MPKNKFLALFRRLIGLFTIFFALNSAAFVFSEIKVGVLSYRDTNQTLMSWQPTATWLDTQLSGYAFKIVPITIDQIDDVVANKKVDYLFVNPEVLANLHIKYDTSAIATVAQNIGGHPVNKFGGVIFTQSDRRDITTLKDLKGSKIAISSEKSFGGYMMQKWEMHKRGIDTAKSAEFVIVGLPQDSVVKAVLQGNADAGFVRTGVIESMVAEHRLDIASIKVINQKNVKTFPHLLSTELYPEWALVAVKDKTSDFTQLVLQKLFEITPNMECAIAGGYYGFSPPTNYAEVDLLLLRLGELYFKTEFDFFDFIKQYPVQTTAVFLFILLLIGVVAFRFYKDNKNLSKELEMSERLTLRDALLDSLVEGVFGVDNNQKCIFINQSALTLLGITRGDVLGKKIFEIIPTGALGLECALGKTQYEERVFCTKDGVEYAIGVSSSILVDGHDDIIGKVSALWDITEQKRAARELEEAVHLAKKADAAKSEFLANMSHEVRTPLNAIIGFVQLLKKSSSLNEKDKGYITLVDKSSKGLLAIIDGILDFSKVEANKLQLTNNPYSPVEEFSNCAELFFGLATAKNIYLQVFIDPNLPGISIGDELKIRQILSNLLSNSIKFTQEKGVVTLDIRVVKKDSAGCEVLFRVKDTGIGMDEESAAKLFKPFEQADSSITRSYGGTGLGLAISQKIAQLMGGEIKLKSAVGIGSEFSFTLLLSDNAKPELTLPKHIKVYFIIGSFNTDISDILAYIQSYGLPISIIEKYDVSAEDADIIIVHVDDMQKITLPIAKIMNKLVIVSHFYTKTEPLSNMLSPPFLPRKIHKVLSCVAKLETKNIATSNANNNTKFKGRVLIVDDQETNRILLQEILADYGLEFAAAADGFEAFEAYKRANFDLVLMDIHMPRCDGLTALKLIREYEVENHLQASKIFALSADALKGRVEHFVENGFDGFLAKPLNHDALHKVLVAIFVNVDSVIEAPKNEVTGIENQYFSSKRTAQELGISEGGVLRSFETFLISLKSSIEQLEIAIGEGNINNICDLGHKIKGSAANLRIDALFIPSSKLEDEIETLSLDEIAGLFETIKSIYDVLVKK